MGARARVPQCQKNSKNSGLDQYDAGPFKVYCFAILALKGLKEENFAALKH